MPFTASELRGKRVYWLCVVTLRGREYRFSTEAVSVTNANDGTRPSTLRFLPGLDPVDYTDDAADVGTAAGDTSMSITLRFVAGNADGWADIADADLDLGDAHCAVYEWVDGDDWSEAREVISGSIDEPTYGPPGEPVSFTVAERAWDDRSLIPDPSLVVTSDRWPRTFFAGTYSLDEGAVGATYPQVRGAPGVALSSDPRAELLSMPGLLVEVQVTYLDNFSAPSPIAARVLLVGADASAVNGTVTVANMNEDHVAAAVGTAMERGGMKATGLSPELAVDDEGHRVVIVQVDGATDIRIAQGDELYWACESRDAGGQWNAARTGAMRGAGSLAEAELERSTLRVDSKRMAAFKAAADMYRFDFWFNESRSAIDIIDNDLLPYLPAFRTHGKDGHYLRMWPWGALSTSATFRINPATRGGYRVGQVEWSSPRAVRNAFTIHYAYDLEAEQFARRLRYAPTSEGPDYSIPHPLCYASFTRYGLREADPVECRTIEDPATAALYLEWRARAETMPYREVSYMLPAEYRGIDVGDVGTITDDDAATGVALTDEPVVCIEAPRGDSTAPHKFRTLPSWMRDAT